jgi:hypothetical protein
MSKAIKGILATKANLKKYSKVKGIVMFSPFTMEQFSATPGDYFNYPDNHIFRDSQGNKMILVCPTMSYEKPILKRK